MSIDKKLCLNYSPVKIYFRILLDYHPCGLFKLFGLLKADIRFLCLPYITDDGIVGALFPFSMERMIMDCRVDEGGLTFINYINNCNQLKYAAFFRQAFSTGLKIIPRSARMENEFKKYFGR
jgi:hypothetical protein